MRQVVVYSTVRRRVQRFPLRRGCTVANGRGRPVGGPRAKRNMFRECCRYIELFDEERTNVENRANVQRV